MPTILSPGGSMFPYYYKGGEIHCLKYGSFHSDEARLLAVMCAEEEFILKHNRKLTVWVDFYETRKTDKVLLAFLESTSRLQRNLLKLAVVGFTALDQWRIRRMRKKLGLEVPIPIRYFTDPEAAKTWLVSEGELN